jgi:hypothetical protein
VTEAEWLTASDPMSMLEFLRGKASDRRVRLLGCNCCRRCWPLLDNRSRSGVEASERYADGGIDRDALRVTALAHRMYESRDFSAMPILADALQDAGCDNDDILTHCRGGGEHVRGCSVVDLILGKS